MDNQSLTRHAEKRMRQRGLRGVDIDLLVRTGSLVGDDTYFMTGDAAALAIAERKREIQQIERLRHVKVVICEGVAVTAYHANPKTRRLILRKRREAR